MSNEGLMAEALAAAGDYLDVDQRAWVMAIGRQHDPKISVIPDDDLLRTILTRAYATGYFPTGAFDYVPHEVQITRGPAHSYIVMHASDALGGRYLECHIGFGPDGFIGVAMTRSGRISDGAVAPGHVLLTDVESALLDLAVLIDVHQAVTGIRGGSTATVSVVSDVPDSPLRLRFLDEETGALAPALPPGPPQDFRPVSIELHTDQGVDVGHRQMFQALTEAAVQFGASRPQLLGDPDRQPVDYQRQVRPSGQEPATACCCAP